MIKLKKLGLTALGTLAIATPIATVVSCGTPPSNQDPFLEPFSVKTDETSSFSDAFQLSTTNTKDNDLIKDGKIKSLVEIEKSKATFDKKILLNITLSDKLKPKILDAYKKAKKEWPQRKGYHLDLEIFSSWLIDASFFKNDINSGTDAQKIANQIRDLEFEKKTKVSFNLELPAWLNEMQQEMSLTVNSQKKSTNIFHAPDFYATQIANITTNNINLSGIEFLGMGLTTFDTSKLPSGLKTLDLSYNKFTTFDTSKLPSGIESLDLSYNKFTTFDPSKLPSGLKTLKLSDNKLTTFDPSKLPSSIEELDLSVNKLTTFDPSKLPSGLKTLDISINKLATFDPSSLPASIESLRLIDNLLTPAINKKIWDWKASHNVQ